MNIKDKKQKGFTIIELLIATAVFSLVLVVFLTAVLRVSQMFYKGVNMSRTQETARNVVQSIADDITFSRKFNNGAANYFCAGTHRYSWNSDGQVDNTNSDLTHGIVREDVPVCSPPGSGGMNGVQLLDSGMQVNRLTVDDLGNGSYAIWVHLVFYGSENSVLVSPSGSKPDWRASDAVCSGPANSTQYCATADYKSTVLQKF